MRVERTVVEREIRLSDFVENITAMEPLHTGVLPANCCYYGQAKRAGRSERLFVILLPDHMQALAYKPTRLERISTRDRNRVHSLEIALPPTLWFFSFREQSLNRVYARTFTGDITEQGEDTPLFSTHLPNFNGPVNTGNMCVGSIGVDMNLPFSKRLGLMMREVLGSTWNDDLDTHFAGTGVTDMLEWHENSKKDKNFWKKMKFTRAPGFTRGGRPRPEGQGGETFGELCRFLLGDEEEV